MKTWRRNHNSAIVLDPRAETRKKRLINWLTDTILTCSKTKSLRKALSFQAHSRPEREAKGVKEAIQKAREAHSPRTRSSLWQIGSFLNMATSKLTESKLITHSRIYQPKQQKENIIFWKIGKTQPTSIQKARTVISRRPSSRSNQSANAHSRSLSWFQNMVMITSSLTRTSDVNKMIGLTRRIVRQHQTNVHIYQLPSFWTTKLIWLMTSRTSMMMSHFTNELWKRDIQLMVLTRSFNSTHPAQKRKNNNR